MKDVIVWMLPALGLLFASWAYFNSPPTNRTGTTFALFYFGLVIYSTLVFVLWFLVILVMAKPAAWLGATDVLPAFAALIVVLAPQLKSLGRLDETARQLCSYLASIPREADQLALELANRANFHLKSIRVKTHVSSLITNNFGPNALKFENDGSASYHFTRAVSLYWLFVAPYSNASAVDFDTNATIESNYAKIMKFGEATVLQAKTYYESLITNGLAYFTTLYPTREMEEALKAKAQNTCNFVCHLIARFVLVQERTSLQRKARLSNLGFGSFDHVPAIGADKLVASMLVILVMTLAITSFTPRATPLGPNDVSLIAIVFSLQIGVSIFAGTVVARRFIHRDDGAGFPPIFELTVAALIVLAVSAILRIVFLLFPLSIKTGHFELTEALRDFALRWPGVIFPFVSTLSIGFLCCYVTKRSRVRLAILGAICNGLAFVAAAVAVGWLLDESILANISPDLRKAKFTIMITAGIIGVIVGAMVVAMFRKPVQSTTISSDPVSSKGSFSAPLSEDAQKAGWSVATLGGYSRTNVTGLEGRYVCFRQMFNKPEVISVYLITISWDTSQSCLVFVEEHRADGSHNQYGQIYIPDGKPFMNLLTMEKGAVRVIMVSRPDDRGVARGLIMTLANPHGMYFTPASAPIVLQRLGNGIAPEFRFVSPGDANYEAYQEQLSKVLPSYGLFPQFRPEA